MTADTPLFDGFEAPFAEPAPDLSAGQRLTQRQAQDVAIGRHPLTRGALHPDADRTRTRDSGRTDPLTCGTCVHREAWGRNGFPKCVQPSPLTGKPRPVRLTHGPATDVRAWWPACPDYAQADGGDA